jgi:hypothetical protein
MKANSLSESEQKEYLTNVYGIKQVNLTEDIQHFCPLGEQVGITHYEIEVYPGDNLAELLALHWDIQSMVGTKFTLESGAKLVLEKVMSAYSDANYVKVTASCGMNRHMPATVIVDIDSI